MKKIYISGKISGLPIEQAEIMFQLAAQYINRLGYEAVNPMDLHDDPTGNTWEDYLAKDIEALLQCQAIYMLNNWGSSRGARLEYAIAKELGLEIKFQETLDDVKRDNFGSSLKPVFGNKCNSKKNNTVRD